MVVGVVSPVLVLLILSKNVSLGESGLVMSALSAAVVALELPSGIVSDRIGRKRTYLIAQALFLCSFVLLLFAGDFGSVLVSFLFFGAARAFASGSIESDFIDSYLARHGGERLDRLITGMGVGETLGLALGALIGGVLPALAKGLLPGRNEFTLNIAFQILLTLILIGMTVFFHEAKGERKQTPIGEFLKEASLTVRRSGALKILLAGAFVWGFAFLSIELYWQPRLRDILADKGQTAIFGYLNGAYFIVATLGTLLGGRLIARYKPDNFLVMAAFRAVLGTFLAILAFQSAVALFSVFYLLIMGANGMLSVPESTEFNLGIPEEKRASLLSLSSLVMQLGGIFASLLFSLVVASVGIKSVWIVSGALFALSAVPYALRAKGKRR